MSHKIFDNELVAILRSKVSLTLNKSVYIGMGISELSTVIMYELHYDYIKSKCENKSKLLFGDTDSLMYEIKTENVYEDFCSNKQMFDFSNNLAKYYGGSSNFIIGKMNWIICWIEAKYVFVFGRQQQ